MSFSVSERIISVLGNCKQESIIIYQTCSACSIHRMSWQLSTQSSAGTGAWGALLYKEKG